MLSRNKVAQHIATWIRDQLQAQHDKSLIDNTNGPGILVERVSANGSTVDLEVAIVDDEELADYKFKIQVGMDLSHLLGKPGEPSPP